MRRKLAISLVRYISEPLNRTFLEKHHNASTETREYWKEQFYFREKYFLPIALFIDKESATEQMIIECWWG